jgi:hypothetical protein
MRTVYLFDKRNLKNSLSEINLGGGIWRLKTNPLHPHLILVASMHSGFHVLTIEPETGENVKLLIFHLFDGQNPWIF